MMAYTPCYRREAGSAGRDTRGMLRAHEFDKVEILAVARAEQAPDAAHRDGRPRRGARSPRSGCRTGSSRSAPATWARATTAASTSRSTRRAATRGWRSARSAGSATTRRAAPTSATGSPGRRAPQIAHTLNGSALAVPRVWAAIVENYRQPDGSVAIPEVLHPYMRGAERHPRAMTDRRWRSRRVASTSPPASTSPTSTADPMRAVAALVRPGRRGRLRRAERVRAGTVDRDGFPQIALPAGPWRRRARVRRSSPTTSRRRAAELDGRSHGQRCCSPGCSCTARCASAAPSSACPRRRATPTSRPAPRASQIGAWASPQSQVLPRSGVARASGSREFEATFADVADVPRPAYWGGWLPPPVVVRVLAGPPEPPPRPRPLPPSRRRVDHRAPRAVAHEPRRGSARPSIRGSVCGTRAGIPVAQNGLAPRTRGGSSICTPWWRGRLTGLSGCRPRSSVGMRRGRSRSRTRAAAAAGGRPTWSASRRF